MSLDFEFPFNNLKNSCFIELFNFNNNATNKNNFNNNIINYVYPSETKFKSKNHDVLSILVINIRSLNRNFIKLKNLLNELKVKPTVITVSETWITDQKPFLYTLDNYIFLNKPNKSGVGGAGIFVQNSINYKIMNNLNLDTADCEDLWIKLNLASNKSIIISSIYKHPSYAIQNFQENLIRIVEIINRLKQKVIIAGDININFLSNHNQITCYKNDLLSQGLTQLVKFPTRYSNQSQTLIDHVYTNIPEEKTKTDCLIFPISDHMPILTYFTPYNPDKPSIQPKLIRDFKNFKQDQFLKELNDNLLQITYKQNLPANELWEMFENILNETTNKYAPLKLQSRKEFNKSLSPWITKAIIKNIKTRQKLYHKYIQNRSKVNWLKFCSFRNKINSKIVKAKQDYYKSEIIKAKSSSKNTWKVMNQIMNLKFKVNSTNEIKEINDETNATTNDKVKICNIFNDFFTSIGNKLSELIDTPIDFINNTTNNSDQIKDSFFLRAFTPQDVKKYILELNPKKATKSNCIPIKIIKISIDIISPIISKIFNKCINEAIFPNSLKAAEIRPIFKTGNKLDASNHRPISILSPFSKIFEIHINNQLANFMTKHKVLHNFQYGFRTNSSTEMAVSQIIEEIATNYQNGEYTCAIFLDLKKAFDTVDHEILLNKLSKYGVRGLPADLIKNYLNHRTQQTFINNTHSNVQIVNCGIPQGSILGPHLFNTYINDIVDVSNFSIKLFADDACLILSSKNPHDLENNVNNELEKINLWRKNNKLSVNFTKSKYLIFTNKKQNFSFKIHMDGTTLDRAEDMKYLGIIIDHKLKWNKHINYILNKISRVSYMLTKIRYYIDLNSLKLLYYSLIHPHLIYCVTTWGGAPKTTLKPLVNLQKKIVRIITKSPFDHPSEVLFNKLDILPFNKLYKYHLSLLMHKVHNNKITGKFNITPLNKTHSHRTRSSVKQNYHVTFNKLNVGLGTFTIQGPKFWQKIPTEIKILPFFSFKRALKQYLSIILNEEIT